MNSIQARDAKARLSELLDAAERGETTIITRHGKPVAQISLPKVPAGPKRVNDPSSPYHGMTLADVLMAFPGGIDLERDTPPMREIDL